jgi:hypothetical protein
MVPNLAPDQTRYAAPLLSLPERPERFLLQTPNTDTSCDDDQTESYERLPRHDFFSLDAGALMLPWCAFLGFCDAKGKGFRSVAIRWPIRYIAPAKLKKFNS